MLGWQIPRSPSDCDLMQVVTGVKCGVRFLLVALVVHATNACKVLQGAPDSEKEGRVSSVAADEKDARKSALKPGASESSHGAATSKERPHADGRPSQAGRAEGLVPRAGLVVFDAEVDAVRASLRSASVAKVALVAGGRSVAFKIELEDGTVGIFKPEQSFAANWYSELASYYLDRLLGLGRVPPAIGRRFAWERLQAVVEGDEHADEVVVRGDGTVRGSFSWWVPEALLPVSLPDDWENWLRVEEPLSVSPFQRPSDYLRERMARQAAPGAHGGEHGFSRPEPKHPERPAELADVVLFDFLTGNHDRWGGGGTNVRVRGKGGPIVFIDNANGFPVTKVGRHSKAKLQALQRFRRGTLEAIERLSFEEFERALASDPLAPLLTSLHLEHFRARHRQALDHVEHMKDRYGEAAVPW